MSAKGVDYLILQSNPVVSSKSTCYNSSCGILSVLSVAALDVDDDGVAELEPASEEEPVSVVVVFLGFAFGAFLLISFPS